jgi:hypothetical protein
MRRYPLRRSIHNLPVSDAQTGVTGRPTARPSSRGDRPCPRRRRSTGLRFFAPAAGWRWRSPVPMVDGVDEAEIEPAANPFLEVPWWTLGRATSKRETPGPAPEPMSSGDGHGHHILETILRQALMDLTAALQEIERQLTAIADTRATPTRR